MFYYRGIHGFEFGTFASYMVYTHITLLKFKKKIFILKYIQCQGFQKRDAGTVVDSIYGTDTHAQHCAQMLCK